MKSTNKVEKKFHKCIYVSCQWNRLRNSWLSAVEKIFEIEKFLGIFFISNISFLNILAIYMYVPYKVVSYNIKSFTIAR